METIPPPFNMLWFQIVMGIIIGLVLGSFTTMLCYRIPRKLSIIFPSSHCPQCHTPLRPRDLIPLISWLSGRGKCRYCKSPINVSYLYIEIITALLCMSAFVVVGFTLTLPVVLFLIVISITSLTIWFKSMKKNS